MALERNELPLGKFYFQSRWEKMRLFYESNGAKFYGLKYFYLSLYSVSMKNSIIMLEATNVFHNIKVLFHF
jgi:hypothetical protein